MTTTTTHHMLERQPGKGIQIQLALDDAFADGDDQPFEFSSAAVREHLAEQAHWTTATDTSSVDETDASISTFYLDGSTHGSLKSDSASVASDVSTSVDQESSHDLSHVPLSEVEQQADRVSDENDHNGEEPAHPTVHIDVSKPPSRRVSVVMVGDSAGASDGTRSVGAPSPTPSALDLPTMPTSPSLPSAPVSVPPPQSHKSSRSAGPTAFQKALSKTRPSFLPPKNRQEDLKHLADWEAMMKQSRATGDTVQLATMSLH